MENDTFNDFPQIITERLKLREIKTDDAESIYKILSNPDVIRYDTFDLFTNMKQAYDLTGLKHNIEIKGQYFGGFHLQANLILLGGVNVK